MVAGASSHISKEMIELSCFQIMMFLCYFFVTTSSVFCFLFFFFLFKVQSKIGVRIIHGRAIYTGKYGNCYYFGKVMSGLKLIAAISRPSSISGMGHFVI